MTRSYYRLSLVAICALAAMAGPVWFLEDRIKVGYLLGGMAAAALAWCYLYLALVAEPHLPADLQGVLGATAGAITWVTITLVAVLEIIPSMLARGVARFDPVWIMAGLSPLAVLAIAWWRTAHRREAFWPALFSSLFRFSVPLFGLLLTARLSGLPKQYRWLSLFTGIMFLVLDGLGIGSGPSDQEGEGTF